MALMAMIVLALSLIHISSIAKLSKNENVNTEILQKICNALDCDICDIMEAVSYTHLPRAGREEALSSSQKSVSIISSAAPKL